MNKNAEIFKTLVGKKIVHVDLDEEYGRTHMVTLFFDDGTKYVINNYAEYADDSYLEIWQDHENLPIPDEYYLYHDHYGYVCERKVSYKEVSWSHNIEDALLLKKTHCESLIRILHDNNLDIKLNPERFSIVPKYRVLGDDET